MNALLRTAIAAALLASGLAAARGESTWREGFEGPETAWRPIGSDVQYRLPIHHRATGVAHGGDWCEQILVSAGNGTHIHFALPIEPAAIIDELAISLWLRSDRSGITLLARAVLPHTRDPRTNRPLTTLVSGAAYGQVGTWQLLRLSELPKALEQRVQSLRTQTGLTIDTREAYLDAVALNVYGGPGETNLFVDDLELRGVVRSDTVTVGGSESAVSRPQPPAAQVALQGSVLLADRAPLLPLVIDWQGESLGLLRNLGFNAVRMSEFASPAIQAEAEQLGLWLICPPPNAETAARLTAAAGSLSAATRRVLAWDLGSDLTEHDYPRLSEIANGLKQIDGPGPRPCLGHARSGLRTVSRATDALIIERLPLGTTFELRDFATWTRQRPRLARPGTPVWSVIQTQPSPAAQEQFRLLSGQPAADEAVDAEPLRLLAYTAVASGARGLAFHSRTRLDEPDLPSQRRSQTLELLNLELRLAEPWIHSGNFVNTLPTSDPDVAASLLETQRAQVVVLVWQGRGAQLAPGQTLGAELSFVVPGVPDSYDLFEVTPAGIRRLRPKRISGGVQVAVTEFTGTSIVLLTQDPTVLRFLQESLNRTGRRAAELQRLLSAGDLKRAEAVCERLELQQRQRPNAPALLKQARDAMRLSDQSQTRADYGHAYQQARRAQWFLGVLRREHWKQASDAFGSPIASPLTLRFADLAEHGQFVERLRDWSAGPNRMPGGDFESLDELQRTGWQHVQHPQPGVAASVELCGDAVRQGRFGLRLKAEVSNPAEATDMVEAPPVWVSSPAIPLEPGSLVRISGWVYVPAAITGSVDGLLVFDSLGGEPLGERFSQTAGWKPFNLYRAAGDRGTVSVTLALTGLGEAWIDSVQVSVLQPGSPPGAAPALPESLLAAPNSDPRRAASETRSAGLPFLRFFRR